MTLPSAECDSSGSLVERLRLEPSGTGPLDGFSFTVKDNIDLAGRPTSYGSPAWRDGHPVPCHNALCVDQLLRAGATCVGKAVADEFTYSLDGESQYFGTPLNARAPGRVPGGSSSGSASSVANGICDFSLGTDSGGSIRVPASLCGVWGMRPSLHRISEAGVLPFMPSVSTVGVVAAGFDSLQRAMRVLIQSADRPAAPLRRIVILQEALEIADAPVRLAAEEAIASIAKHTGIRPEAMSLSQMTGRHVTLGDCNERALRGLQTSEFQSTVGNWIESRSPELSVTFAMAYRNVRAFDRVAALDSLALCERLFEAIDAFLAPGTVVCFPTTPVVAPVKGSLNSLEAVTDFYGRTMAITSFSGVGRLPEVSAPLLTVDACPVGLSIAAAHYQDEFLMSAVRAMVG